MPFWYWKNLGKRGCSVYLIMRKPKLEILFCLFGTEKTEEAILLSLYGIRKAWGRGTVLFIIDTEKTWARKKILSVFDTG